MWGFGGRHYWGRRETGDHDAVEGIVVVFAWSSSEEKYLKNYSNLYSSLGWNSLICHSQFLNQCIPETAASLASIILVELVKELKIRPCPVVFASFSGGPKACMYKVLQSMGAPYLILCLEDDNISSSEIISNFAQELESLGGNVKLVKWSRSEHVAHYRHHPLEYKAAVTELLRKATVTYSTARELDMHASRRRGGD